MKIIRLEDLKIFNTKREAETEISGHIGNSALENHTKSNGYHWSYYIKDVDYKNMLKLSIQKDVVITENHYKFCSKKIICLNDRKIYNSISSVVKHFGIKRHLLLNALKYNKEIEGFAFTFLTNEGEN